VTKPVSGYMLATRRSVFSFSEIFTHRITRHRAHTTTNVFNFRVISTSNPIMAQEKEQPRRKRRRLDPVAYDIPDVEKKQTQFRGRLGYACLNTLLRATKPDPIFCSRTCRLDTIAKKGIDFVKDLGLKNVRDLITLIQWNEDNRIRFMRISSELFPFASHLQRGYALDYAAEDLKAVGDLANKLGHRLTTHPGQFTQLASPKPAVVEASVRELEYHTQMLDLMGLGPDSVIIIHLGVSPDLSRKINIVYTRRECMATKHQHLRGSKKTIKNWVLESKHDWYLRMMR